ncbi:MAG: glucuronate isomerase [Planctomycetaceae bacterium]|jgi:glucuronate isomerase|nr:glucuronate isomerase [Planctomycetaceae bacterium]
MFITENFLLRTPSAVNLYHNFAKPMPIIDYHSHLQPSEIADNKHFRNITEVWLSGDHYKWRAMRAAGVDERFITSNASDREKFDKWAWTVPQTLRNPLYHWTHLELARVFSITDRLLNPQTADYIWNTTNELLQQDNFTVRELIRRSNVEVICTTDDPIDTLEHHKRIAADKSCEVKVFPTFRPDKIFNINALLPNGGVPTKESLRDYNVYIDKLAAAANIKINDFDSLLEAIKIRHDYFHQHGCRLSDHGFREFNYYGTAERLTNSNCDKIFQKLRNRSPDIEQIDSIDEMVLSSVLMREIAKLDAEKGWTIQLHVGVIRNNNTRLFKQSGVDIGCDSMNSDNFITHCFSRFFDHLDKESKLPKTIVYNLNPVDGDMMATMIGNFQDGKTPGKMQYGSGWWFLDQRDGMRRQIDILSNYGLLSKFVGMLTDSRSFLSFTRHEYFRRILCDILGEEVENGLLPSDDELIGNMVNGICYNNAKEYFGFG